MIFTSFLTKLILAFMEDDKGEKKSRDKRGIEFNDLSPIESPINHLLYTNGVCDGRFNWGCEDGSRCLSPDRLGDNPYWDCWTLAPPRRHNKSQRKANWCKPDEEPNGCGEGETCILTETDDLSPWYRCYVLGEAKPGRRRKAEKAEEEDEGREE